MNPNHTLRGGRGWLRAAVSCLFFVVLAVGLAGMPSSVAADDTPATLTITKETNPDGGRGLRLR